MISLIGLSAFLSVFCLVMFFYHKGIERRKSVNQLIVGTYTAKEKSSVAREKRGSKLQKIILLANQAGYDFGGKEVLLLVSVTIFVGFVIGTYFIKNSFLSLIVGLLFLMIPYNFFLSKRKKRQYLLRSQFADILQYWVNSMTAGADLSNAIIQNLDKTPMPLQHILGKVANQLRAGDTILSSLRQIEPFMGFSEYKNLFLLSVELSQEVGRERFREVLLDTMKMIKAKERTYRNMLAYTSQGRHISNMVMVAPYVFFVALQYLSPDYMAPVTSSIIGQFALFILLLLPVIGRYIVGRMIEVHVD